MAQLVIGHTTDRSAKVWLRGGPRHRVAWVRLISGGGHEADSGVLTLDPERDRTAVADLGGLEPATLYSVTARFARSAAGLGSGKRVEGGLRTFPRAGDAAPLRFLIGSCNLAPARLTAMRERLAAYMAISAVRRTLSRDVTRWYAPWPLLRRPIQRWWPGLTRIVLGLVDRFTRYQLPEPDMADPFRRLREQLAKTQHPPAFLLHVGDQIYADVDYPRRESKVEEYRRSYREAWFEDAELSALLSRYPQYMILDDHDAAGPTRNTEGPSAPLTAAGLRVYGEYVHSRNPTTPAGALYYDFEYGCVHFFVMDVRTERDPARKRMISDEQFSALLSWLDRDDAVLKVVVSSVPFLTQVSELGERHDKWCGDDFRAQRDQLLDTVLERGVEHLIFLCGDMHCTYHTVMTLGTPERRVVLHELAGGPFNQVEYGRRAKFHEHYRGRTQGGNRFTSAFESFSSAAPSVLSVEVDATGCVAWQELRLSRAAEEGHYEPRTQRGRIRWSRQTNANSTPS